MLAAAAATTTEPWINFSALWKILVVGLLAGAGLPAIFAIGLRSFNYRSAGPPSADDDHVYGGNVLGGIGGVFCVLVVLAAIGYGVDFIVQASK